MPRPGRLPLVLCPVLSTAALVAACSGAVATPEARQAGGATPPAASTGGAATGGSTGGPAAGTPSATATAGASRTPQPSFVKVTYTYRGTWTATLIATESPDLTTFKVGDKLPGTVTISCNTPGFCGAELVRDGQPIGTNSVPLVAAGTLKGVLESKVSICATGGPVRKTGTEATSSPTALTLTRSSLSEPRTCADGAGGTYWTVDEVWTFTGTGN